MTSDRRDTLLNAFRGIRGVSGQIQRLHTILGWEADAILRKGTADDGDLRSHYDPAAEEGARALDSREGLR